jgi:hypothetical protein
MEMPGQDITGMMDGLFDGQTMGITEEGMIGSMDGAWERVGA